MKRRSAGAFIACVGLFPVVGGCAMGDFSGDNPVDDKNPPEEQVTFTSHVHQMPRLDTMPKDRLTPAITAHLNYYGGPVLQNVKVVQFNWTGNVDGAAQLPGFYGAVTQSTYFDWLNEYNTSSPAQTIGRGSFVAQVTDPGPPSGSTIDDSQIQAEISKRIGDGTLPTPDANTLYMTHFPPGITITQGGSQSCQVFCAYHGTFVRGSQNIYYGVLPDLGGACATECGSSTKFNNLTSVSSHELVEAVTDAAVGLATVVGPPLAWYDPTNGEIGDICNAQQGTIAGYTVQKQWSNANNACIVTSGTTPPPTNDFSISTNPTTRTVAAGSSTTYAVNTTVVSGSGTVSLAVTGLPTGVTASFSPTSVQAGGSSTLTVNVSSSAAAGTSVLTVTGTEGSTSHSATPSLVVTSSAPPPPPGALTNGVPVTGIADSTVNHQKQYTLDVPAGATNLTFQISGGTGDADLYVKFGSAPTLTSYECRPYIAGNNETCTIANIQAGTYYVMLNAYAAYSGLTLVGSYSTGQPPPPPGALTNGVPVTGIADSTVNHQKQYSLAVPAGATNLTFRISGGTGDADLYVRFGAAPTTSTYDCRPYITGNNETCTITNIQAGTYYVMLNAYTAYSGVTLVGSYSTTGGTPELGNGVPVSGIAGATGSQQFWKMSAVPGGVTLSVSISGGTGDADLYVNAGAPPTTGTYVCRPYLNGNTESCTISAPAGGATDYYIMLRGYAAFSGVTLRGSHP